MPGRNAVMLTEESVRKRRSIVRAPVTPELLTWARERSQRDPEAFSAKFPKLPEWEDGSMQPTLRQAEDFARFTYVPFGLLFLDSPPKEELSIPDFRRVAGRKTNRPSPNLLDTIRICRERQVWYQDHALLEKQPRREFVGSAPVNDLPSEVAIQIGSIANFDVESRSKMSTWTEALRTFIQGVEKAGILVMVSGVVEHNRRPLDPAESRGFTLSDPIAPLIFINGSDSKAAQMYTLAHELGHVWLGGSALSGTDPSRPHRGLDQVEVWCNAVAGELLVPREDLRGNLRPSEPFSDTVPRLARVFKVSRQVILRRLLDVGRLDRPDFVKAWEKEIERSVSVRSGAGGDFYRSTIARVGRRFAEAVTTSTLNGQALYRDAFRMLGIQKTKTFENLCRSLKIGPSRAGDLLSK